MILVAAMAAGACRTQVPAPPSDPVVATVDRVEIHASQVASQMRIRGTTADPRAALQDWVVFELLARAAADATSGADADQRTAMRLATVQRMLEREIEPLLTPEAIPDAEVRALYEKGKPRFVHGRLVQVLVMGFFTGARMKAGPRARAEHNAALLKAFLDEHPPAGTAALEALAREPLWVERKLSVSTVWQEENQGQPYPESVGRALTSLHGPGDRSPLVIDETGAYIAVYLGEKPAEHRSFEEVAPALRAEMYEPWRRQRFLRLVMDMASGHDIAVDTDTVALLASKPAAHER